MLGVPSRVIIGHGRSMEAIEMWSSINLGTQVGTPVVTNDDAIISCSHPYPMLVNGDNEGGGQDPRGLGMLSNTVGVASEEGAPHKQGTLLGVASEASVEEGEVVHPLIDEATRSGEGLWRTRWSDQDHTELLQEIVPIEMPLIFSLVSFSWRDVELHSIRLEHGQSFLSGYKRLIA